MARHFSGRTKMNLFLIENAYAQAAPAAARGLGPMDLLPLVLIVAVFYFVLIRPQTKRQKEHKQMLEALSKGDEIVSGGGLAGRIVEIGENFLVVEVAKGVEVKVQKQAVATVLPKGSLKAL